MTKAPISFRAFDDHGKLRRYFHGLLPHWRQEGCTYFVTFRLADSIPSAVLSEIEYERDRWLSARGILTTDPDWQNRFAALAAHEIRLFERLLGRLLNQSLDKCHRSCALRDPVISHEVARALDHFHGDRVWTGDFVVMPNHVHVLLTPRSGFELEDILQAKKSYTAHEINRRMGRSGPFWQRESHDHIVRDLKQLGAFQNYIAANPEKANLSPGEYVLSGASYVLAS